MNEQEVSVMPEPKRRRSFFGKRLVILIFLGLAFALLFYAFTGEGLSAITGSVISGSGGGSEGGTSEGDSGEDSEVQSGVDIRAELSPLSSYLEINQEIDRIEINLEENEALLQIGEGAYDLNEIGKTNLEFEGFRGDIVFDGERIYSLNGEVFKAIINEVPTSSISKRIKVGINAELAYESIELNSVYMRGYMSESEVGKLEVDSGKADLKLRGESFVVSEFNGKVSSGLVGNFGIKKQGFILVGSAKSVNVGNKFNFG